jgi:hypothetical protein
MENWEVKNKCLLSKWLYQLTPEEEGIWLQLLQKKYLHCKTLSQVTAHRNDSPFWKGLMRTKVTLFNRGKFIIGDGRRNRFWRDTWLGETSLALQYPMIYNIVQRTDASVSTIFGLVPLNI